MTRGSASAGRWTMLRSDGVCSVACSCIRLTLRTAVSKAACTVVSRQPGGLPRRHIGCRPRRLLQLRSGALQELSLSRQVAPVAAASICLQDRAWPHGKARHGNVIGLNRLLARSPISRRVIAKPSSNTRLRSTQCRRARKSRTRRRGAGLPIFRQ